MRILVATPLYPPDDGGPATYSRLIENAFPVCGVATKVLSFGLFRKYPKVIRHVIYALALYRACRDVDLIYALDPVSVGFPAAIIASLRRKKFVIKVVGDYAWEQGTQRFGVQENLDQFVTKKNYAIQVKLLRKVQEWSVGKTNVVIVPSVYLKKILMSWGVPDAKIKVVYNAFDPNVSTAVKELLRKRYHYDESNVVISVGRMVPWKGFIVLMDAVSDLRKEIPNARLVIAGSGDDSVYRSYARERGYNFVEFLGAISHVELIERMRAADCFALNTGYEGLSHVLLEAMAVEVPVVTTDVGGNTELFSSGDRGMLVAYNNKVQLVVAIRQLLVDKTTAQKFTRKAKEFVASFSEERMVQETCDILQSTR